MNWDPEVRGSGPDHPDCGADAAAYAMGALEPAEAEAFRRHLATCAICAAELASFEQAIQALPMSVPQYEAPKDLRRRVMREIAQERKAAPKAATGVRWRLTRPVVAMAGTVALLAVGVFGGAQLGSSGSAQTHVIAASVGDATVRVSGGRAELIVKHLPQPKPGKIYQVWLKHANQPPQPTRALFDVNASGRGDVVVPESVRGSSALLVTAEPAGGSPHPTSAPVVIASLS